MSNINQISIPRILLDVLNTQRNKEVDFAPLTFHNLEVSKFLAFFYREVKITILEEIDEGFQAPVLDKHKSFFKELDIHVYSLLNTDYQECHSYKNHEFVEAIHMLYPNYIKALSHKLLDEILDIKIATPVLKKRLNKFNTVIELQNSSMISHFCVA